MCSRGLKAQPKVFLVLPFPFPYRQGKQETPLQPEKSPLLIDQYFLSRR